MRAPDGPYSGGTPRSPKLFDRHAGDTVSTPEMVELMRASGVPIPEWFAMASKSHRAAIRPPPEFAVAPPQSARAPLPYRRCTDEYGGIEHGVDTETPSPGRCAPRGFPRGPRTPAHPGPVVDVAYRTVRLIEEWLGRLSDDVKIGVARYEQLG